MLSDQTGEALRKVAERAAVVIRGLAASLPYGQPDRAARKEAALAAATDLQREANALGVRLQAPPKEKPKIALQSGGRSFQQALRDILERDAAYNAARYPDATQVVAAAEELSDVMGAVEKAQEPVAAAAARQGVTYQGPPWVDKGIRLGAEVRAYRSAQASTTSPAAIENQGNSCARCRVRPCVVCAQGVDPVDNPDAVELRDGGGWVCSPACWSATAEGMCESGTEARQVYLAGPMYGYPGSNFPAFAAAAKKLRAAGYVVTSPHELSGSDLSESDIQAAFKLDFMAIIEAGNVVLLPGWQSSRGVAAELVVAKMIGATVFEFQEDLSELMGRVDIPEPEIGFGLDTKSKSLATAVEGPGVNAQVSPAPLSEPSGLWRCSCCGEAFSFMDGSWRVRGENPPQHKCPKNASQAGHFDAEWFGPAPPGSADYPGSMDHSPDLDPRRYDTMQPSAVDGQQAQDEERKLAEIRKLSCDRDYSKPSVFPGAKGAQESTPADMREQREAFEPVVAAAEAVVAAFTSGSWPEFGDRADGLDAELRVFRARRMAEPEASKSWTLGVGDPRATEEVHRKEWAVPSPSQPGAPAISNPPGTSDWRLALERAIRSAKSGASSDRKEPEALRELRAFCSGAGRSVRFDAVLKAWDQDRAALVAYVQGVPQSVEARIRSTRFGKEPKDG